MEGWDSLIRFLLFIIAELCCRRQSRLQGVPIQNVLNVIDSIMGIMYVSEKNLSESSRQISIFTICMKSENHE